MHGGMDGWTDRNENGGEDKEVLGRENKKGKLRQRVWKYKTEISQ